MIRSVLAVLLALIPLSGVAQDRPSSTLEDAVQAYGRGEYARVRQMLRSDDSDQGRLYFGKASFMDGLCGEALPAFWGASASTDPAIALDALHTLALCQIQLRDYPAALQTLREVRESGVAPLAEAAGGLYLQLIAFLTPAQTLEAAGSARDADLVLDLYRYGSAPQSSPVVGQLHRWLTAALGTDRMRAVRRIPLRRPTGSIPGSLPPPDGFVSRMEVLLPAGDSLDPETMASRSLYNGMLLAVEEHNATGTPHQIHLSFTSLSSLPEATSGDGMNVAGNLLEASLDAASQADMAQSDTVAPDASKVLERVWFDAHPDVVIGPLYSESAVEMSRFASQYGVPVVTPLANSDQVGDLARPGIIQLNPTFEVHGRRMARHAVNRLGLRTISIIADRGSLGFRAASAFKEEAERLGAVVPTYFVEDLQGTGYDISPFLDRIEADPEVRDSLGLMHVEGVYAPFTGQAAQTLIRLLITGLEGKRSDAVVLGSEEWNSETTRQLRPRGLPVYYSTPFNPEPDQAKMEAFRESYARRFGVEPDLLSMVGRDVGAFVASRLERVGNPSLLIDAMTEPSPLRGLLLDVDLDGFRVNQRVHILRMDSDDRP